MVDPCTLLQLFAMAILCYGYDDWGGPHLQDEGSDGGIADVAAETQPRAHPQGLTHRGAGGVLQDPKTLGHFVTQKGLAPQVHARY